MRSDLAVVVLARAPEPGRVKTRLAADLGAAAATSLHEALALDVIERLAAWGSGRGALVLALTGAEPAGERLAGPARAAGFDVERQVGGDLGARVHGAVAGRHRVGARRVLVLGTDCVELPDELLDGAAAALLDADVVLAPAADGGYVLVGARRLPAEALAGVRWGTGTALADTEAACRLAGLSVARAPGSADVDTVADLERLATRLATAPSGRAPRTRAWLAARGQAGSEADGSGCGDPPRSE